MDSYGQDDAYDLFYGSMADLDTNDAGLWGRGAGYLYGADMYYWFSQILYEANTYYDDPTLVASEVQAWWMSGLMVWMIPMFGTPAPHNIIIGQWEPTDVEADYGITDGFGAVSALLYGADQCGMAAHPIANERTAIFEGIMESLEAEDGSWTAMETIFSWEANDCASSSRDAFPNWGDYGSIPQFAKHTVDTYDWSGAAVD